MAFNYTAPAPKSPYRYLRAGETAYGVRFGVYSWEVEEGSEGRWFYDKSSAELVANQFSLTFRHGFQPNLECPYREGGANIVFFPSSELVEATLGIPPYSFYICSFPSLEEARSYLENGSHRAELINYGKFLKYGVNNV